MNYTIALSDTEIDFLLTVLEDASWGGDERTGVMEGPDECAASLAYAAQASTILYKFIESKKGGKNHDVRRRFER